MPNMKDIQKQAADLMGFTQKSVGKIQARKDFFSLVDAVGTTCSAFEITDHDKPVAVLMSYQHYVLLVAKICMLTKIQLKTPPPNLIGSIKIKTENLESASERISAKFAKSLKNTASKL